MDERDFDAFSDASSATFRPYYCAECKGVTAYCYCEVCKDPYCSNCWYYLHPKEPLSSHPWYMIEQPPGVEHDVQMRPCIVREDIANTVSDAVARARAAATHQVIAKSILAETMQKDDASSKTDPDQVANGDGSISSLVTVKDRSPRPSLKDPFGSPLSLKDVRKYLDKTAKRGALPPSLQRHIRIERGEVTMAAAQQLFAPERVDDPYVSKLLRGEGDMEEVDPWLIGINESGGDDKHKYTPHLTSDSIRDRPYMEGYTVASLAEQKDYYRKNREHQLSLIMKQSYEASLHGSNLGPVFRNTQYQRSRSSPRRKPPITNRFANRSYDDTYGISNAAMRSVRFS